MSLIDDVKNIHIYDLEVFAHDWIAVFFDIDNNTCNVFTQDSDIKELREYLTVNQPLLCGFNNKHYDDYILLSMLSGASPEDIKKHNDYIIEGGNPWDYSVINGMYKKDWFKSFDLRDDLDLGLSLKAIEGNLCKSIVESSIDFTYTEKLDFMQLNEVIQYCIADVSNTYELFKKRKSYLNGKLQVAQVGNLDPALALSLTNPKLASVFLKATPLSNPNKGELEYTPPDCLQLNKYVEPLEFYKHIDYEAKFKLTTTGGLELVYGWGGIHGAIPNYHDVSTDTYKIVDIDVGSYYPSMIIECGYIPNSIPSAQGYIDIYNKRIEAKHTGDSNTAGALKLVLNSTYGALKNRYNPLYEPKIANHICITGQLLLTDLIEKLEPFAKIIQANTDGIMISYKVSDEKSVEAVVSEWEKRTKLNMEYSEIHSITQKDVNNYVLVAGATYLIKDGQRTYTKEDKHTVTTKGGYVSLANGGDFKNNSAVIVHKALVNYFLKNTPVEETIKAGTNIFDYQYICKTGSSYDRCIQKNGDIEVPTNKVNRVYATKDTSLGTLYKLKEASKRADKIAGIPEHCFIDNSGKEMSFDNLDYEYYIAQAKSKVNDYLGIKEPKTKKKTTKKEREKMATKKTTKEVESVPELKATDYTTWNIYEKLAYVKVELQALNIKKTGVNAHLEFMYYKLEDFIKPISELLVDIGLLFTIDFTADTTIGTLINTDNPTEVIRLTAPYRALAPKLNAKGNSVDNELQRLGMEQTYQRRYMYLLMFDIVEPDMVEPTLGDTSTHEAPAVTHTSAPATPLQRAEAVEVMTNTSGAMTDTQKESIRTALSKLQADTSANHEAYIAKLVAELKAGNVTVERADNILNEVAEKLKGVA